MKILMLAPEPFFQVRGTPFSIYHRLKALSRLGHSVDLLTYHIGENVSFPGLSIHRIPRIPIIRHVPVGPSLTKLPLDVLLVCKTMSALSRRRYDCVHTHEEAAVIGAMAKKLAGIPHVYDMHSSLPEQLLNYNYLKVFPRAGLAAAKAVERFILSNSDAVIAICPHLKDVAIENGARGMVEVIENVALIDPGEAPSPDAVAALKRELGADGKIIALYTGTFEYNQGIEEIIMAARHVVRERPDVLFVLVGGEPHQVENARKLAKRLGVEEHILLPGKRPLAEMPAYMGACHILLSFRKIGTNTPLKIYSYLYAGKPIVATDLPVHTQVLTRDISVLTDPDPEAFAKGIAALASDSRLRDELASRARRLAEKEYTYENYLRKLERLYAYMGKIPTN